MSEPIRDLIHQAANDQSVVERLRKDPESLKEEFDLSDADVSALKKASGLVIAPENPLLPSFMITLGTITITGSPPITLGTITITGGRLTHEVSGDPAPTEFGDLSQHELVKLTERILRDPVFAEKVRSFIGIAER